MTAAAICFEENNFAGTVSLKIEQADKEIAVFHFNWKTVNQQVKDMHNDLI
jgi:hypothetical protein